MNKENLLLQMQNTNDGNELFDDKRTLDDVIAEVASEEGLSFEQAKKLFLKGLKDALGSTATKPKKDKDKAKQKRKQAKASRKKNRK